MSPRIRSSFVLGFAASSLLVASTASASTPGSISWDPSLFPTTNVDVIGTGKSFDQTWTVVDWDAKRDTGLGTIIDDIHGAFSSLDQDLKNASGIPGISLGITDPHFDANATLLAYGRAYVQQAASSPTRTSSMGLHAEAKATISFRGLGFDEESAPGVQFDASYHKPPAKLCGVKVCGQPAPYYQWSFMVRGPKDATYTTALGDTVPNPLADSKDQLTYYAPTMPNIDVGFIQLPLKFSAGIYASVSYSLDPTGGNIDLYAETYAPAGALQTATPSILGVDVHEQASAHLEIIGGQGSRMQGAAAHAKAWINAFTSVLGGSLCGGAKGTFDANRIGAWSVNAQASASKQICVTDNACTTASIGPFNETKSGVAAAYSKTIAPPQQCITF